jgi:hypothetical protein
VTDDVLLTDSPAHIINHEGHQIGDKVLAICGVKWKVNILWDDIPAEYPICRDCVDTAIMAMDSASAQLADALAAWGRADRAMDALLRTIVVENTLSEVIMNTSDYAAEQARKAEEKATLAEARALVADADKAEKKKAKKAKKKAAEPPVAPPTNTVDD